ncbi:zinc-binding dehydrogenase [Aquabacterium sp. A7-Y]|uniref:zinc-binding dehydrogenase n=1 Tax=Aquabacterium sp. A7-Y TaxID=1349605 RepID=UPI0039FDA0C3
MAVVRRGPRAAAARDAACERGAGTGLRAGHPARALAGSVSSGRLRPVIGAQFALDGVARAHALSVSGHARAKIVLYIGRP